ncbi:hypothetical protein QJS66_06070 [Kocuria rhizophila]|nr:hypothetical protein QJS66_06070 [Kocuria rhizophila]
MGPPARGAAAGRGEELHASSRSTPPDAAARGRGEAGGRRSGPELTALAMPNQHPRGGGGALGALQRMMAGPSVACRPARPRPPRVRSARAPRAASSPASCWRWRWALSR